MSTLILLLIVIGVASSFQFTPPSPCVQAAIGAISGSAGALLSYPFDYVKAQLQTVDGRAAYPGGMFDAFENIIRSEPGGMLALYRGVELSIYGCAPESAISFVANESIRNALFLGLQQRGSEGSVPLWGEALAGALAGVSQVVVTNPIEALKIAKQTSRHLTLKEIYDEIGGWVGLYRGAGACAFRDAIFSVALFVIYPHARDILSNTDTSVVNSQWAVNIAAGCIASASAGFISTPADVVKTRMQAVCESTTQKVPSSPAGVATSYHIGKRDKSNALHECLELIANEPDALFSGWLARVSRFIPQYSVSLVLFDTLNKAAISHGLVMPIVL